ncbi:MAG: carboxypeptidase C (cathepsin A) [Halieaceae bacterium]|jgi:carboxypeptidase C (cathepsin A)
MELDPEGAGYQLGALLGRHYPRTGQGHRSGPTLNIFVAAGYYDLVTPFFDAEFTLNRYGIAPGRVEFRYYGGGHMMYLNEEARIGFLKDVRAFIAAREP